MHKFTAAMPRKSVATRDDFLGRGL